MTTPESQRRIDEAPDGTPAGVLRQWWEDVGWNLNGKSIDHELPYREIVEVLRGADYKAGYRQAINDTGRCGAYNPESPPSYFALCVRPSDHTGKHDDTWRLWGDPEATSEDNARDAAASRATG